MPTARQRRRQGKDDLSTKANLAYLSNSFRESDKLKKQTRIQAEREVKAAKK